MNSSLRNFLFRAARLTIFILVVLALGYAVYNRPKPVTPQTLYIGDPTTACAYPYDSINIKKLNWHDAQGDHSWEEFSSLEEAKKAGYRLCH